MLHHITIPQKEIENLDGNKLVELLSKQKMLSLCGEEVHILYRTPYENEQHLQMATCERCLALYKKNINY